MDANSAPDKVGANNHNPDPDTVPVLINPVIYTGLLSPIGPIRPRAWSGTEYYLSEGKCKLDLGVIADPGGPRDSEILMATDGFKNCDAILKYDAYYTARNYYVKTVTLLDPNVASYNAFPIERIDAADDGAFSFTNINWVDLFPGASPMVYYAQVWNVLDNIPKLHVGPNPDDSRYWNNLKYENSTYPVDVCDDFELGQHALFTSGYDFTPEDLTFLGVMDSTYTYNQVRFSANLDPWAGMGTGRVNPMDVRGIDVIEGKEESAVGSGSGGAPLTPISITPIGLDVDPVSISPVLISPPSNVTYDAATLYVLENNGGLFFQVEVFKILDTAPGMSLDTVYHFMTIDIDQYLDMEYLTEGKDIEILPVNSKYKLNSSDPTLCVLVSYFDGSGKVQGEVFLYNATTGAFLEAIGDPSTGSALPGHQVAYLDTDDGDWEIHVTSINPAGNTVATIFSY